MMAKRIGLAILLGAALAVAGCSDDGDDGMVDTSGACGIICDGGEQQCVIEGFDPADGLQSCTQQCQAQWTNEQDCAGPASFVIECVDANQSCTTLEDETCGDFPSSALGELLICIEGS